MKVQVAQSCIALRHPHSFFCPKDLEGLLVHTTPYCNIKTHARSHAPLSVHIPCCDGKRRHR